MNFSKAQQFILEGIRGIKHRRLMLGLALVIGLLSGTAAVLLKQDIGHGVSKILFSISRRKGHLKPHNTWSSMLASSLTVGLGGSVGLEAPIAALIFCFEVLMLDLTAWSMVPLLLASVTATTLSYFMMGEEVVFSFTISEPFVLNNLPFYLLLGVFTGLVSLYFTRMNNFVEHSIGRIKHGLIRTLTGGLIVSVLIFIMPQLFGEGYITLKTLLTGQSSELFNGTLFEGIIGTNAYFIIGFFVLLILFKVVAMALTTGSGGVGGVFAPALFVGGMSGATLGAALKMFTSTTISENNFALVGMAGVMAGVMHAPLTAIFLIAEITGGYTLFIPLIITATISYLTIVTFEKQSIYTKRLARRGELMTHHKDKAVLSQLTVEDVLEKDFKKVRADDNLAGLVKAISKSKRNIFPVVDDEKVLVGIIRLDDIRDIIFNTELYERVKIPELMHPPSAVIRKGEKMERVLEIFEETEAWNLPVTDQGQYIGFISRSKIFNSYRKLLKEFSDD